MGDAVTSHALIRSEFKGRPEFGRAESRRRLRARGSVSRSSLSMAFVWVKGAFWGDITLGFLPVLDLAPSPRSVLRFDRGRAPIVVDRGGAAVGCAPVATDTSGAVRNEAMA